LLRGHPSLFVILFLFALSCSWYKSSPSALLSLNRYYKEKDALSESLRRRAHMMTDGFNSLENVSCVFTEGAMYSFPRLHLPPKVRTELLFILDYALLNSVVNCMLDM
jgi:aspartate/methionine/tyrosine aminotransferase